ncbi:MAG TPA: aspartate aminotransferase family protein [Bryobacteraceae bacterium]|nr:aspartate aminotransferase family protein [Bryobacteraceae bacterium]
MPVSLKMPGQFNLATRDVPPVDSEFRRIAPPFPHPCALKVIETLRSIEPLAMQGQPPVVWDRAEGFQVRDRWGNKWIDWSSGVLITNAGHGRKEIADAIAQQAESHLLTNYCFPSEIRARMVERLASLLPEPLKKVFLLTTGSETVECSIKLSRSWGVKNGGKLKHVVVSYEHAFHGRTLGSQQAGGIPPLKEWIVNLDPGFVQIPFPDGWRNRKTSFESFEDQLRERGVEPANVAGVIMETYQGGSAAFAPPEYMQALRGWCTGHKALLVLDEVQAGFGRCGTLWGWEHYGIVPDVACFGKGISGSLPISAVAGRADVMDLHPPNSMTSTHTGNPVCCAAALASIDLILNEDLAGNARRMGEILHRGLNDLKSRHRRIGRVEGKGLVAGVACVRPGGVEPDGELAWRVVERSIEKGVLMFAPVGYGGATVKICPPLVITEAALRDSLEAFEQAFAESI